MTRRPGLTLTEVLVTLAILAFGVLGIMTLFPLAASQMAVAVREDRSAQAAHAADGYFRAYWKSEYVDKDKYGLPVADTFDQVMTDPNFGITPPHGGITAAAGSEPSYPLSIDPMGHFARGPLTQSWIGDGGTNTNMPRRSLTRISDANHAFRVCSLMDSLGYDENGHPLTDREMRYNVSWIIQRPLNSNKYVATMYVLVYDFRPNLYAPTAGPETTHITAVTQVNPGSTTLTLGNLPNVKPGSWIMDVTDPALGANKIRHAIPYQVVSVNPPDTANNVTMELQTPLKKSNDPAVPGAYTGKFVVLKGVAGVYERPPLGAD